MSMSTPGSPKPNASKDNEVENISTGTDNHPTPTTSLGTCTPEQLRRRFPEARGRSVTPVSELHQPQNIPDSPSQTRSGLVFKVTTSTENLPNVIEQNPESVRIDTNKPGFGHNSKLILSRLLNFISGSPIFKILLVCALVLCLLFGKGIGNSFMSEEDLNEVNDTKSTVSTKVWEEKQLKFRRVFRKLRKDFPSQTNDTFIQIGALVEFSLVETEQRQPSAVVVLIPPHMKDELPNCLITKIANVINRAFEPERLIDAKILSPKIFSEAGGVKAIHNDLKAYFDNGGRAVLVEGIDKFDNEPHLLVFHAFCDNSFAYQKRAVFFFLLPVPEDIYKKFEWTFQSRNQISYAVLDRAWSTVLTPDKRPAFIARVDGSTVLLNEGDIC